MSCFILEQKGVLLPVGSGICRQCRFTLYDEMKNLDIIENRLPKQSTDVSIVDDAHTKEDHEDKDEEEMVENSSFHPVDGQMKLYSNEESEEMAENPSSYLSADGQMKLFSDEESVPSSQPCSQSSSWGEENNNTLEVFNKAVALLHSDRGKMSPLKFKVHQNLESLKPSTTRLVKRKATEAVHLVLENIAPRQGSKLLKRIQEPQEQSNVTSNLEQLVVKLYSESTDKNVKKQLLSMIAFSHTKKQLQQLIPSLTIHAINEARKHASEHSEGADVPKQKPVFHKKMDMMKLDHALDFIFNPSFHQVSSIGTKELRLEDGSIMTIPEVIRTVWHSTLIKIYQAYCEETQYIPLSRSTLYHILRVCPASKRTNLKGLDNAAADGGNAYDVLLSTVADVEKYVPNGILLLELKECKESIVTSRIYMKTDFKMHVKQTDHCSDHCINYALSDPHDKQFQQSCIDHQHDVVCDRCQLLPNAILSLKGILNNLADLSPTTKEGMFVDIDAAEVKIIEWKSHVVRTINQDNSRTQTLKDLEPGDILLVMDWAMKYLPVSFREKQSDWYGQKGINWHVSVCIYRDEDSNLKHRTYAHMMDGVRQDWMAVACLLEDTIRHVKMQHPSTARAFLRSDNAGCYHCGNLWLAIPGISRRTGCFHSWIRLQ
ncbi:uncharacterized protein LOC134266972 [Saccostrea cucullata]|uniref:uncharacterized protein LOC134266972 n=1 Tax=Saccostrea cuccullata TaxID=36930 RepID=UPI002ED632A6